MLSGVDGAEDEPDDPWWYREPVEPPPEFLILNSKFPRSLEAAAKSIRSGNPRPVGN